MNTIYDTNEHINPHIGKNSSYNFFLDIEELR